MKDLLKECSAIFFDEVENHLATTEGVFVEPNIVQAKKLLVAMAPHRTMKVEVTALQDNDTWELVRSPRDRDVIPGKWVYKVILKPSDQVDRYKARYLAKGFKPLEVLVNFDTFEAFLSQRCL